MQTGSEPLSEEPGVRVRPFRRDEWRTYKRLRLRALEDAPEAFATTLAEAREITDEAWQARLARDVDSAAHLPVVAEDGVRAVGLVWAMRDPQLPDLAHLFQMWVAPEARRRGTGARLIEAVVVWARARRIRRLQLDVTTGEHAARRLYERAGFAPVGESSALRSRSTLTSQTLCLALDE